jgi:GntR family transcriptional regulator/MocR family aminotransferase
LPQTILYQSKNLCATRLGFGHLEREEMEKAVEILNLGLRDLLNLEN